MRRLLVLTAILAGTMTAAFAQGPASRPHNVVLFVADGLRFRSVDDVTAPTMAALAREGVSLRNSHALFPTFTMANASVMATGHMLGDTGVFSNTIYTGFQVPSVNKTVTPFLESDPVLGDVDEHFSGNFLNEATILKTRPRPGLQHRRHRQGRPDPDLRPHRPHRRADHHRRRRDRQPEGHSAVGRDDRAPEGGKPAARAAAARR